MLENIEETPFLLDSVTDPIHNVIVNQQSTLDSTPTLLLEQLIYVEHNFGSEFEFETQMNQDLSIFADASFIFHDEEKPKREEEGNDNHKNNDDIKNNKNNNNNDNENGNFFLVNNNINSDDVPLKIKQEPQQNELMTSSLVALIESQDSNGENPMVNVISESLLSHLPKTKVPIGAEISLLAAGLNQIQIDALAALVYQKQQGKIGGTSTHQATQESVIEFESRSNSNLLTTPGSDLGTNDDPFESSSTTPTATRNNSIVEDEDMKKRRNTAASARFRVKKKLKVQELERQLGELRLDIERKQARIEELMIENKLLKKLLIGGD